MEFYDSWYEEKQSAYIYRILAQYEKNPTQQDLYRNLADMAEEQALIWEKKILSSGANHLKEFQANLRTRTVIKLIKIFGAYPLRPILAAMKIRGISNYTHQIPVHPPIKNIEDLEHHHKDLKKGGSLRAAVFGINDGLISNASLIFGMSGGNSEMKIILLAGIAGMLAGAFSMASGEYVSVRSQREMYEYQINLERQELALYPQEEAEELALIYMARGLGSEEAHRMANKIIQNPEGALLTLAREELGLDPNELGSPIGAASASFIFFALGAFIPLLPFLLSNSHLNVIISGILTGVALFIVGAAISLFTGRNAIWCGLRMFLMGCCSAVITYFIGMFIGNVLH